jgi:FkbM family methyltransferase
MATIVTKEGWHVVEDNSQYSHSSLVIRDGRIDVELCELATQEFVRPYVLPGSAAIDAGAHLGCHAIPLMRYLGRDGLLLAFEPDPELFGCLCENVAKEFLDSGEYSARALCYQSALSDQPRPSGRFWRDPDNRGAGHLEFRTVVGRDKAKLLFVEVTTLDAYAELLTGRRLSFIKIDVEGAEIDVIRGARELIANNRPVLFVETSSHAFAARGITPATLEEELRALNYRYEFFPRRWVEEGKPPHDLLALPL